MPVVKFIVVAIVLALRVVAVTLLAFAIGFGCMSHTLASMINYPGDE